MTARRRSHPDREPPTELAPVNDFTSRVRIPAERAGPAQRPRDGHQVPHVLRRQTARAAPIGGSRLRSDDVKIEAVR
jgi:hypothetical protein